MSIVREYELTYTVDASQAIPALKNISDALYKAGFNAERTEGEIQKLNAALAAMAMGTAGQLVPAVNSATTSVQGLGSTIIGLATSWIVIEKGIEAIGQFGDKTNAARDMFRELGEDVRKMRDDFRELANLRDKAGPDDEVVAEAIMTGSKAGMTPQESRRFMEQFMGSNPAGFEKGNITKEVSDQVAAEGMKFGTRLKINPETMGDFSGVMSQYGKIGSLDEGAAKMGKVAYGLNKGRGNLEPLMKSLLKTAGALVSPDGGAIDSLEELAVMQGMASTHASPDAAGTKMRKAALSLRDFKGEQGRTLEGLGIKPGMSYWDSIHKIAPRILDADAKGVGGDHYLRTNGFRDQAEITAIVEQARDLKAMEIRMGEMGGITGGEVMAQNQRYLKTDKNGKSRQIRAQVAANKYIQGRQTEELNMAREAAEIEMRDKGEIGGFNNNAMEFIQDAAGLKPFLGYRKTSDRWKDDKAFATAHEAIYRQKLKDGKRPQEAMAEMGEEVEGFDSGAAIGAFHAGLAQEKDELMKTGMFDDQTAEDIAFENQSGKPVATSGTGTFSYAASSSSFGTDRSRAKAFNKIATDASRTGADPYVDASKTTEPHLVEIVKEAKITNQLLQNLEFKAGPGPALFGGLGAAGVNAVAPAR